MFDSQESKVPKLIELKSKKVHIRAALSQNRERAYSDSDPEEPSKKMI